MKLSEYAELCRATHPVLPPTNRGDRCGFFVLRDKLRVIASDGSQWFYSGTPWEHVSVSTATRCPTWDEMCFVKRHFFGPDELVVQFHPPESQYVNHHPFCLHLWRPVGIEIPLPPADCVGPRTGGAS